MQFDNYNLYAFLFSGGNIPPYQEFAVILFFWAKIGPNTTE